MTPSELIKEMIRADLELAYDHLLADQLDLYDHQVKNTLEKSAQLRQLRGSSNLGADSPPLISQPLLIDAGPVTITPLPEPALIDHGHRVPNHEPTHNPTPNGSVAPVRRRKAA